MQADGEVGQRTVLDSKAAFKPKFHYANFHRNFPAGKVVNANHESNCRHKFDNLVRVHGPYSMDQRDVFLPKVQSALKESKYRQSNLSGAAFIHCEARQGNKDC